MLIWMPMPRLGRGFFAFHAGVALAMEITAHALTGSAEHLCIHGPYAASLFLLLILFSIRRLQWTPMLLRIAATAGAFALATDAYRGVPVSAAAAIPAVLTSALVAGSMIVTMNLGHWYLVIHGLPLEFLGAANRVCVWILGARIGAIAMGAALAFDAWKKLFSPGGGPLWDTALFLTVRVSFGLVAPLILAWMIHECVKIKSTQSATGILYVSVVFVLIGELSGMYFLMERGLPL